MTTVTNSLTQALEAFLASEGYQATVTHVTFTHVPSTLYYVSLHGCSGNFFTARSPMEAVSKLYALLDISW